MSRVYVGLGSNIDDPLLQLHQALEGLGQLPQTTLAAASPLYRSRPVGPSDQPDFLNMAVQLDTALTPLALLDHLQQLEHAQGRQRTRHWGPRTLDLDILLWGDQSIDEPRLQVPHPQLPHRDFVLQPLLDLDPALCLPDGTTLQHLRAHCPNNHLEALEPR